MDSAWPAGVLYRTVAGKPNGGVIERIVVKIAELTAFHVRIPLRKPIRHASHSRTDTDNVLVRCVLDDRTEGWGEGVPRDYVTGETIDSALALLERSDLAAQSDECPDFAHAVAFAERLRLADVAGDDRGIRGNAARCAVELAVLDAYGRRFGDPVSEATRLLAPELYEPRPEVRYSGAITSAKGFKLRLAAWAMRLYGFRQLKVKVGIAGQDDADRLRSIRKRVGAGMDLRIDANEAWPAAEAAERIRALEPFGDQLRGAAVAARRTGRPGRGAAAGADADHAGRIAVRPGGRGDGRFASAPAICSICGCRSAAASFRRCGWPSSPGRTASAASSAARSARRRCCRRRAGISPPASAACAISKVPTIAIWSARRWRRAT